MYLEVTAVPDTDAPARLRERFTPRPGAPLRIGPGRTARVRLKGLGADLEVAATDAGLVLRAPPGAVRASLSGVEVAGGKDVRLSAGDTLYVHPGLAFAVRDAAPVVARAPELEARLREAPDDDAWAVYADFLEEHGDGLATPVRQGVPPGERLRRLEALADAARGGLLEVRFDARGFLVSAHLARQTVVGSPGVAWHLAQLATLPAARFLKELGVALFGGDAPARVDDEQDPDVLAARTLERLAGADYLPGLERLMLGFVRQPREWPRAVAAFERLCARAPRLAPDFSLVVRTAGQGRLVLASHRPDVAVVSSEVVLNPGRSDVGGGPSCLVRLVGEVPPVACTLHRMTNGQWVLRDERADPFSKNHDALSVRVNGVAVARATLSSGDTVEPVPGLVLRFVTT